MELFICTVCKLTKTRKEFGNNTSAKHGKHSDCKVCRSAANKLRYETRKEKMIANAYKWRAENPERYASLSAGWRNARHDHVIADSKRYRAIPVNRQAQRVRNANRRALERAAPGRFTPSDIRALYVQQLGQCAICKCFLVKYHIDHIYPLSKGGSNWPANLQLLCPRCNLQKSDKLAGLGLKSF